MEKAFVTIAGNLTRDPELRFTQGGRAVINFGVAVTRSYRANEKWQEETGFYDCVAWGKTAEWSADVLAKGVPVVVYGRLDHRIWETQDGDKRSKVEIVAERVALDVMGVEDFTRRQSGDGGGGGRARQAPPQQRQNPLASQGAAPAAAGDDFANSGGSKEYTDPW